MPNGSNSPRTVSAVRPHFGRGWRGCPRIDRGLHPRQSAASAVKWLGLFLLAFLLQSPARAVEAATKTIVFFGDSLTFGYGLDDPPAEAYPTLIQKKIDEAHLPYRVVNAGVSGETSAGGVRRVDWVLRQSIDIFVLALGANDGLRGIEPAVTRANLQAIVSRVRTKCPGAKIAIAGMMMPSSFGADYVREYDAIFPDLAKAEHATLIPFLLDGVAGHDELNQADRIHPTAAGHAIVADNVWKVLRPLL